tara:strand:+ start:370 stop:795 length:426 start_codon:yes stop_codon:yes gene_type:complete
MEISDVLLEQIKNTKSEIDKLVSDLSEYDDLKSNLAETNNSLVENLSNFSNSLKILQEGAIRLAEVASTIEELSKVLSALDISKINERLLEIENQQENIKEIFEKTNIDLEKNIKKKLNKVEENLEDKIKNSSLFGRFSKK